MAVCDEDQGGNSYLIRGFGIFSHQIAVTITYNRGQKARRACIIIANIKSEFYFFVCLVFSVILGPLRGNSIKASYSHSFSKKVLTGLSAPEK